MKILSLITYLMSFQTLKSFVHHPNKNLYIFDEILEFSDPHRPQRSYHSQGPEG